MRDSASRSIPDRVRRGVDYPAAPLLLAQFLGLDLLGGLLLIAARLHLLGLALHLLGAAGPRLGALLALLGALLAELSLAIHL